MYYAALFTFSFNKLESLKLEAEGACLDLQELPGGGSTLTLTRPQGPARTQGWKAETCSAATSGWRGADPCSVFHYLCLT